MLITLLGYTDRGHTNWYSWNRFAHVFRTLGFEVEWTSVPQSRSQNRLWICWREPSAEILIGEGLVRPGDIVFQKLHAFDVEQGIDYGTDPAAFLQKWHWPVYQSLERLVDAGVPAYGFGCRTRVEEFPEKHRIVRKLGDRIFWMPYGSVHVSYSELPKLSPILSGFTRDIGYVGSRWGWPGMGNLDTMRDFLDPLLSGHVSTVEGHFGTPRGRISESEQRRVLQSSRLCPIVHAPFWRAEHGVQDRFWTVFALGRFGVVDNEGVFSFFSPSEVVCAIDPEEYKDKSLYYLSHVDQQAKYIRRIQERIRSEYNFYNSWQSILNRLGLL